MTQLSSVVLHSYYRSSSAWRVRIALELKALPYSLSPVNLRPGVDEQHQAEFKQRSALMQVPVLEARLGGEQLRLTQSLAIIDLLERAVPAPPLYPAGPRERAWALEAAELVNSAIQPFQNLGTQTRVREAGGDAVQFARYFVERGLVALELYASQRAGAYSVGDSLSVADVLLVPQLHAARRLGVDLAPFTTLCAIEARCATLPAFVAAHPDAQPDRPPQGAS